MSRRRLIAGLAGLGVAVFLVLGVLPELFLHQARTARDAAAALPLDQAWGPWAQAEAALDRSDRFPGWSHATDEGRSTLHREQAARLTETLRPLRDTADADAALAWLDRVEGQVDARNATAWRSDLQLRAGRPDLVLAAAPVGSPDDAARRRMAALLVGDREGLPGDEVPAAFSLMAGAAPPPGDTVPAVVAGALFQVEGHRYDQAIDRLRPLVDQGEPLAAEALALVLTDWQKADPAGLVVVGADADPYAADRLALRSALLRAPAQDATWLGPWLAWTRLMLERDDLEAARMGVWGALEAALPVIATPTPLLPAMARLDSPGAVPPARVQPVRAAVRDWRQAADDAGDTALAAELRTAEHSLELLQARAHVQARDLVAARTRLARLVRDDDASPRVVAWLALTEALLDSPDEAPPALDALPPEHAEITSTARAWLQEGSPHEAGLADLVEKPWAPQEGLATALAHGAADLPRVLRAPGPDGLSVAQALALAHLELRALQGEPGPALDAAKARRDRLQERVLALPLWGTLLTEATLPAPPPPAPLFP